MGNIICNEDFSKLIKLEKEVSLEFKNLMLKKEHISTKAEKIEKDIKLFSDKIGLNKDKRKLNMHEASLFVLLKKTELSLYEEITGD